MIHANVRPQTLGMVRVIVFAIWLAKIVPDTFSFLAEMPRSIFKPVGILRLVPHGMWDWILTADVLSTMKWLLVLCLVYAALGLRPYRLAAIASAVLLTLHQGIERSFTFVNHLDLAALFCVYVLAFAPAADGFALSEPTHSRMPQAYAAAMMTMAFALVLPYASIAAFRFVHSAPDIFLDDSLRFWFVSLSGLDPDGWHFGEWIIRRSRLMMIAKAGFVVTTCCELLSPLCLVSARFRLIWFAVLVPFHILCLFLLNIFFWENILLSLALLTPWYDKLPAWFAALRQRVQTFLP